MSVQKVNIYRFRGGQILLVGNMLLHGLCSMRSFLNPLRNHFCSRRGIRGINYKNLILTNGHGLRYILVKSVRSVMTPMPEHRASNATFDTVRCGNPDSKMKMPSN